MSFAVLIRMLMVIWPSVGVQLARLIKNPIVLAQGGIPIGIPPSSYIANNGALTVGIQPAGSLSFAATSGAGVVVTGTGTSFASTDVGRVITCDGGKQSTITAFTSATSVTVTITGTLSTTAFANNAWWLGSPLPTAYNGAYLYFPANAIAAGVAAGLYYCVMSSTTVGTIYNNPYISGVPLPPASPTAFVTTGPGAYTQSTAELTINTITVSGGSMGANGSLRYGSKVSVNSSANAKTVNVKYGGTTMLNGTTSTAGVSSFRFQNGVIGNQNATNKQVGEAGGAFGGANGVNSGTIARGAIDSTTDQSLTVTATLGVATEYVILESSLIEVMQSS